MHETTLATLDMSPEKRNPPTKDRHSAPPLYTQTSPSHQPRCTTQYGDGINSMEAKETEQLSTLIEERSGLFKCTACPKIFKKKFSSQRHARVVHLGIRPYRCSSCPKEFGTEEQLHRHHIAKHTDMKPFPCEKGCEKHFASRNARLYHYRTYHENYRYRCPYPGCSREFCSQKHLRNHLVKPHKIAKTRINEVEDLEREIEELRARNMQLQEKIKQDECDDTVFLPLLLKEEDDLLDSFFNFSKEW